jgi:3-oxoadipate enol-lactonase
MAEHTTDDGCRLAYEVTGPASAPVLVLSNSLGTDRTLWDRQIDRLTAHFRVLRYDARGHGASDAPAGDYTIDRLGRDVVSLLDAAGVARASVCGVSIGGLTALWLGIHAADRVERLVLANTAARIGSTTMWEERTRLVRESGLETLATATMARWFTPAFIEAEPATIARMSSTISRMSPAGYLGCCAALRDADLRAAATHVRSPCLVVTGRVDVATPPDAGAWLAATIPGAQLVEFDAAHLSNVECAEAFTDAVLTFLLADRARP